jgi:hypothetical protein
VRTMHIMFLVRDYCLVTKEINKLDGKNVSFEGKVATFHNFEW